MRDEFVLLTNFNIFSKIIGWDERLCSRADLPAHLVRRGYLVMSWYASYGGRAMAS